MGELDAFPDLLLLLSPRNVVTFTSLSLIQFVLYSHKTDALESVLHAYPSVSLGYRIGIARKNIIQLPAK